MDELDAGRKRGTTGHGASRSGKETVCVLCRTHGEMLQLASMFALRNVPFSVRPKPEDRGIPSWVARVLSTHTAGRASRFVCSRMVGCASG